MTGAVGPALVAPALLVVAALTLTCLPDRSSAGRRLARVGTSPRPGAESAPARPGRRVAAALLSHMAARRVAAIAAALCTLVVVGGWPGLLAAVIVFGCLDRALAGLPDPQVGQERARVAADLPLALDLLGCGLRAGQPPSVAAAAVAAAIGGPVGAALSSVARAGALGAAAEQAWEPIGHLAGAAATARSLARATHSGTALADEVCRTAGILRAGRVGVTDARIRRAGVLVVLPLGLCFLPAFICVGVLPLVAAVAGTALR